MSIARLHLHLLGSFRLYQGDQFLAGFDQPRLQHLLAFLALHRAALISRQQLAFTFWPDTSDRQARKNLRTLLARLRQALPDADEFLCITAQTLQWQANAPVVVDVAEFEAAVAAAIAAYETDGHAKAVQALAGAVAAYTGDLLLTCYDDWILPLRERLRQTYGAALERLVVALEEQSDYGDAIPYAQRLLQHDPLHEAAYRHLMRLHLAQGNRTEALRAYQACETMLKREFGTAPARATSDLHEALLSMDGLPLSTARHSLEARPDALPLVSREAEWSLLVSAWREASAGRPQMILLTGEAGIGKTRLAEELVAWVARQGVATAAAHCYPQGSGGALAYAPVAEWLRAASLVPRLTALEDAWLVEVARLQPALLNKRPRLTPPGPLTEPWQRTRLFEALAHAVLGSPRTNRKPLLLFVDDLQWADRETLDWLLYLLHFDPSAPLLIAGTLREHDIGIDHPMTASRLALTRTGLLREMSLAPFDAKDTALLAASVAGKMLEANEVDQIYRDTEGNPLFVVEMVRAGMVGKETGRQVDKETSKQEEEGLVSLSTSSLSPPYLSTPPSLPPKVRAVIQWRLSLLSPDALALAQTAAVIGRKFNLDVLARVSGWDEALVVQNLDELWRRQIIRLQGDDNYDFSHAGIRLVAYDEIGAIRRRSMHLRVAEALAKIHSDELDAFSGQIAAHYEQAGEPRLAIAFYRRAAAAAHHIYANAEAVQLYRHLLESRLNAYLSLQERCTLLLALGEVWQATGYWVKAQTVNQQALDAAARLGDVRLQAKAQAALASVMYLQGYYDEALERLAKAEQGFKSIGEWQGVVSTLGTTGQIHWFRGDHQRAQDALEQQQEIAAEIDDTRGMCEALESLGMVLSSQGDWERSATYCLQAIALAETLEHKPIITRASITLGNVRLAQTATRDAIDWYLRAGLLAQQIDDRQAFSWALSNIAMVLAKRGDYRRALIGYECSLRNAWEIGDRWTACRIIASLATVYERQGWIERAEHLYRKAIELTLWLGTPGYLAGILVSLAQLLLEQGRAAEAQTFYRQASGMMATLSNERLDMRVLGIRLQHALGELTAVEARVALRGLATETATPTQLAALQYELWRLGQDDEAARASAAALYHTQHQATGAEDYRARYRELTGATLPDLAPLPDVSELIPLEPGEHTRLDLEALLADLEISFE